MRSFISADVRINFRRLGDDRGVHVHDFAVAQRDDARGFRQKDFTGRTLPTRVGVGKEVADVRFAERAKERVANGVHERVGVRMAVETLRVRNLHAAEDEPAPGDQLMNIVADANVNHGRMISSSRAVTKQLFFHGRQPEAKGRAFARLAVHPNLAAVRLHDVLHN